jgi:anti-anti-sigma factor
MLVISRRKMDPGITVLEASGRITLGRNAQEMEWELESAMESTPVRVIVDLSDTAHIDSTGVGILVMCAGRVRELGGQFRIAGAKGTVAHTLGLCKLAEIVPVCASVEEAAASIAGTGAAA